MSDRHVPGDRLSAFLDDELADDEAFAVAHHLGRCEPCLHELEVLRTTRDALRGLPSLQAPVLTAGVDRRSTRRRSRVARTVVAVVAAPLVVLGSAYLVGGDDGGVEPPTDLFLVEHLSRTGGGPVPAPVGGGR